MSGILLFIFASCKPLIVISCIQMVIMGLQIFNSLDSSSIVFSSSVCPDDDIKVVSPEFQLAFCLHLGFIRCNFDRLWSQDANIVLFAWWTILGLAWD